MTTSYPAEIWDGASGDRSSGTIKRAAPGVEDWARVVSEIAALQRQIGVGSNASSVGSVGTSVTEVSERMGVQKVVLTLDDIAIIIAAGTTVEFGSALIYTFPQGAVKLLGMTLDLTLTCTGADFAIAGSGDYALGSVAASDQALAGTDLTWSIDSLGITSTIVAPLALTDQADIVAIYDGTTTPGPVYLNIAMDTGEGSGVFSVSGTVTLTFVNLGDY